MVAILNFVTCIILMGWLGVESALDVLGFSNCHVNIEVGRLIVTLMDDDAIYITCGTTKNVVLFWDMASVTWKVFFGVGNVYHNY
jgi:hypothetical protein